MNFSISSLNINTGDQNGIQCLKTNIYQCIDQHQFQLQNYFNKDRLLLSNFQEQFSVPQNDKIHQKIAQVFNRYQNCLVQIVNLGRLTISISDILLESIQKTRDSQNIVLQNCKQNQGKLHQYVQSINQENIELLQKVQNANCILETSNQKIKQLTMLLQIQRKSKDQIQRSMQQKIMFLNLEKQDKEIQNLEGEKQELTLNLNKLQIQINKKNKQIQFLVSKNQQISLQLQEIKCKKHLQIKRKTNQLYPLNQISQFVDNQKNKFNSPLPKSIISSYCGQPSDIKYISSPKYLSLSNFINNENNIINNENNKQNNRTQNISICLNYNSPKIVKNQTKIDYAFKNVAVNTQNCTMKTKTTQFDAKKNINYKKCIKNKQIQIQTLKQNLFIPPTSQLKNNLKEEQHPNQSQSIVKSLVRYMSDKVIYHRIKRKN